MAASEERMRILKLVEDGKITAQQALELLATLEEPPSSSSSIPNPSPSSPSGQTGRWFRVRVTDTDTGRTRVNVRLPVSMVDAGLKMGARFSPEVDGMDMDSLRRFIALGQVGKVIDITDDSDGEHIEVSIE